MASSPRGLEAKLVFDWNHQPLGTVLGSELDPRTRAPTSLIVGLNDDAREALGTDRDTISLPFEYVFGIRRDEVRLDRDMRDLLSEMPAVMPQSTARILEIGAAR